MVSMYCIDEETKDILKEVHQLSRLGVRLADAPSRGVLVHSSSDSTFVVDVKDNKHLEPVLMDLKDSVLNKLNDSISLVGIMVYSGTKIGMCAQTL